MEQEILKWVSSTDIKPGHTLLYYNSNGKIHPSALEFATKELADKYGHVLGDVAYLWVEQEAKIQFKKGLITGVVLSAVAVAGFITSRVIAHKKESKSDI